MASSGLWQPSWVLNGQPGPASSVPLTIAMQPPARILIRMPGQTYAGGALAPMPSSTTLFFSENQTAEIILLDAGNNFYPWQGALNLSYNFASVASLPGPNFVNFAPGDNGRKTINLFYNRLNYFGAPSEITDSMTALIPGGGVTGVSGNYFVKTHVVTKFGILGYMASGTSSCSPFVAYTADDNGDPLLKSASYTVTATTSGGSALFANSSCATAASNSIPIGASGVSSVYYIKTPATSVSTNVTFSENGGLPYLDGNSTTQLGQATLHSGTYGPGGANYDIFAQTPATVALNNCFPVLVNETSDYGSLTPLLNPQLFAVTMGTDCPQMYSDPICQTGATTSDLNLTPASSTKLLYSKAITHNSICAVLPTGGGAANQVSPLPSFPIVNSPVIH